MEDVTIRDAVDADVPAILQLIENNLDKLEPRTPEQLRKSFGTLWIAEVRGEIVGCAMLDVYSERMAEIRSVAVRADMRRHGIGTRLIQRAADEARLRGIKETFALTSSPDVFERMGFATSTRSKFAMFLKK